MPGMTAESPPIEPLDPPLPEWAFESLLNPLARRLLRSRFHGLISDSLLLVTVTGRKTGRQYTTPVGYREADGEVWLSSQERSTWWRNCRDAAVTLTLRGEQKTGHAEVIEDDDAVAAWVQDFLDREGLEAASSLALRVHTDELPDEDTLADCLSELVLVRVELED